MIFPHKALPLGPYYTSKVDGCHPPMPVPPSSAAGSPAGILHMVPLQSALLNCWLCMLCVLCLLCLGLLCVVPVRFACVRFACCVLHASLCVLCFAFVALRALLCLICFELACVALPCSLCLVLLGFALPLLCFALICCHLPSSALLCLFGVTLSEAPLRARRPCGAPRSDLRLAFNLDFLVRILASSLP